MTAAGKWAIITGASSGIGRALAREFAAGGFNVLLIGRNSDALQAAADECRLKHRVESDVVPTDLSSADSVDSLITAVLSKHRIYEVLVNNAGFAVHGEFAATDIDENIRLLNVQLAAALKLTRAVAPLMISQGSGKILNVASVYSFAPVPFQSVYSACKAFLLSFSISLRSELKGTGVSVTAFCPGITQTEFRARAGIPEKRQDAGMTAAEAARIAYLGTLRGRAVIVPGFLNRMFVLAAQLLPADSAASLVRFINRRRGQVRA